MKLSCKVIEDMLPIYHDGICSDESATLVEAHLAQCQQCRNILRDLRSEIKMPEKMADDLEPLKAIQNRWKKTQRTSLKKGIALALTALLLAAGILTGIWYFGYAKYYFEMTGKMDHTDPANAYFSSSDYMLEKEGYRFEVWMPTVLSDYGFARVTDGQSIVLFLHPQTGGRHDFWFYIMDENDQAQSVYLKPDMTPDFQKYFQRNWGEAVIDQVGKLVIENREEIIKMSREVYELWGIDLFPEFNGGQRE